MFLSKITSKCYSKSEVKQFCTAHSISNWSKQIKLNYKYKTSNLGIFPALSMRSFSYLNLNKPKSSSNDKESKALLQGEIIMNEEKEILLYLAKYPIVEQIFHHTPRLCLLTSMALFIVKNPLYLKLPVALPIVTFSFFIYLFKYLYGVSRRSHIIDQIWLSKDGKNVRFVFKQGLRIKKEDIEMTIQDIFNVKSITHPELYKYEQDNNDLDEKKLAGNFFFKYITGDKEYILLNKSPFYANFEILKEIFDNKEIKFDSNEILYVDNAKQLKYSLIINKRIKNKNI